MALAAPRWRFGRMQPWEINQNPVQGEFFTTTADLSERFVREALQNSLDARGGTAPVLVRFTFSGEEGAVTDVGRYLAGLEPHIQADPDADAAERRAISEARACLNKPMTWLAIEDFGTTGLAGDIRANDPKETQNDFWGFFRSIGISPKGEDAGGSWGLGKWVFPDASMLNAYLGATRRVGEDRVLLMGMAVLRTHSVDGVKHPPYGQFAAADDGADDQWLPLPLQSDADTDFVLRALADFGMDRLDEPGLSVVVPYPKDEITPAVIARAVITQYFLPVVRGDLSVEIAAPGERRRVISADTIVREVVDIPPAGGENPRDEETTESLAGAIRLAQWATGVDDADYIRIPVPTRTNDTLEQLDLEELRERYERDERLAFELSVGVQRRESAVRDQTSFRVYIERADDLTSGHDYFVRGHLSMSRMDHIQRFHARALVVVDGRSELAHLLRDAEGPAHISWDWYEQRLKDHWIGGQGRVDEVRRSAVRLLQRLAERPDEQQFDALADLFPADPSPIRRGAPSGRRGTRPPAPPPRLPSPPALTVNATATGFSVRAPRDGSLVGSEWSLRFAYDVVRGNPFTLFERGLRQGAPDFDLADETVAFETQSARAEREAANELRFRVLGQDFRLDVSGLDNRDVVLDLRRIEPDDPAVDEAAAP